MCLLKIYSCGYNKDSGTKKGGFQKYESKNRVRIHGPRDWQYVSRNIAHRHGNEFIVEMLLYRLNETDILMVGYKNGYRMYTDIHVTWDIKIEFNEYQYTDDMFVEINAKSFELLQMV